MSLTPPIDDYPWVRDLLYGAMRSSIHAAVILGCSGSWQGDSNWDDDGYYLVDNQQGEYGMIRFFADGSCVGALHSGDPFRNYDIAAAVARAPRERMAALQAIVTSPFLTSADPPLVTAVFWSERGRVVASEGWDAFYAYGANAIWHELMPDALWLVETAPEPGEEERRARTIAALARRRLEVGAPVELTTEELDLLLPVGSPGRTEALSMLATGGEWAVSTPLDVGSR